MNDIGVFQSILKKNEYKTLRMGLIWLAFTLLVTYTLQSLALIPDRKYTDFIGDKVNTWFLIIGYLSLLIPIIIAKKWKWLGFVAYSGIIGTIAVHALKFTVGKNLPRPSGSKGGFPSGHAEASFILAYLISSRYPKLSIPIFLIASVITWSRVPFEHYFYQIVGGGILGLLVVGIMDRKTANRESLETEKSEALHSPCTERTGDVG